MLTPREKTKPVYVKNIQIGGSKNVVIQSMCNTKTSDIAATLEQIDGMVKEGCEIVRLAVPDMVAAKAFDKICSSACVPVVADIHFDYRLALECIANGASKIRINPGNIGSMDRVKAVADACRKNSVPIRIGVNMGSIDKDAERNFGRTPKAMVESAFMHIKLLNKFDFDDIVVSLKASDVPKTVEAYKIMSEKCNYPLHIGVTEAGTAYSGLIKSAMGIGSLLLDGIGDTIRVSLTAPPVEEVTAAKYILRSAGIKTGGIEFVSCPSCGRCRINQVEIANLVERHLSKIDKPLKVAVMGCAVNGPGEAKDADIGIAGGDGCAILFKKGVIIKKIPEEDIIKTLIEEIEEM
ncbi:MAG: flavodoxin-dependent (E)-4-hydroxy-3-methylbut-2-enyl-diphosphate synthase [Clostridia bacterium]|nr:flavodoxin-dependent (E)-4-hydroxy-3-methylbut-2-enyl-diphosphate synthase [Clostridia bacterium]